MLTAQTKQKIDNARDILVGKIPNPIGQVEQITLALLYKFMNDIDVQSKELGGKVKFFNGDYQQYTWNHLMDKSLSAYKRVTLYAEALEKMSLNPNLPQFFRNVFKGAFLPFRDPEVLTLFLKQIDEFSYGHNEELGDAFEYLLQVMGTQGEAGQFLTPRHIINFIVSIVDPQKTDRILDPACGTAGFLISAYQHILRKNTKGGSNKPGSALSFDDRKKMTEYIVGYDISHDMVRLSLVNLYLHDFSDPKIHEYDTLTSQDRWDDDYECILTNPPFMTPKGGIRPHKRFSIQANRSEVLFVDYIMEHLTPTGKAGIIVPEGIIFQSANAYKALRKMMVEQNYLYAVISLPAGVFQPYSGVKTSILLMDKVLAKNADSILFIKVESDGYELGAQRKPIDRNDLPGATDILLKYKNSILTGQTFEYSSQDKMMINYVLKKKVSNSGDYSLSGDRYREIRAVKKQKWPLVCIGEICQVNPKCVLPELKDNLVVSFIPMSDVSTNSPFIIPKQRRAIKEVIKGYTSFTEDDVLIAKITPCFENGKFGIVGQLINDIGFGSTEFIVLRPIKDKISSQMLFHLINNSDFRDQGARCMTGSAGQQRIPVDFVRHYKIPVPPLEMQQRFLSYISAYQNIIDGALQVITNYKPYLKTDPAWDSIKVGKIIKLSSGRFLPAKAMKKGNYNVYGGNGINGAHNEYFVNKPTLIIGRVGEYCGCVHITEPHSWITDNALYVTKYYINIDQDYLYLSLLNLELNKYAKVGGQPSISQSTIYDLEIYVPPINIQKQIVERFKIEQQMVAVSKDMVTLYKQKIKDMIDDTWKH